MTIPGYKSIRTISVILLLNTVFAACIKEKFDPAKFDASIDFRSGLAIPIGFSHLGFEKYFPDSLTGNELRIGKDGFMSLYYYTPIDSGVMEDLISISDANSSKYIVNQSGSVIFLNSPGSSFIYTDSLIIPITSTHTGARIDSIRLLSGTIQANINSNNLTGTILIQINGLRLNGLPFSTTRNLANPGFTLPLSGYSIIPGHDVSGNNILECAVTVSLQSASGPVNPGVSILDMQMGLSALSYETIYGDFGGYTIDFPARTIPTPFFNQLTGGQILFADPKFKLFFSNSAGVPFGIWFRRIDAIDGNRTSHSLTGPGIPAAGNPEIINYPSLVQAGQIINDSLIIDRTNSNLPGFINATPDSIVIEASAEIVNPTCRG